MTRDEIMLRHLTGHHLLTQADPQTVVRDLCGVQAQYLSNALHAIRIRSDGTPNTDQLVKSWTIRGTMHLFHADDLPLMLHRDRTHALRPCDTLEGDDNVSAERKRFFAEIVLCAIDCGECTRDALKARCADCGMTEREAAHLFNPWGGLIRALCECGAISHAVSEQKAYVRCPAFEPMARDTAQLELARRYFTHYGPATIRDAAYFFGATQAEVKTWLGRLPVVATQSDGKTYYWIETGEPIAAEFPECVFLAGFDPLMLGYQKTESLYLPPEHLRGIFSLTGIVMPAVMLRGRVVGRWKKTGKEVSVTLFETVGARDVSVIEESVRLLWPDAKQQVFA